MKKWLLVVFAVVLILSFSLTGCTQVDPLVIGDHIDSGDLYVEGNIHLDGEYYGDGSHLTGISGSGSETDPIVGAINGIVKANGSGTISSASAGTDYQAPLPDQTGNDGKVLGTDGSALSWVEQGGGSSNAFKNNPATTSGLTYGYYGGTVTFLENDIPEEVQVIENGTIEILPGPESNYEYYILVLSEEGGVQYIPVEYYEEYLGNYPDVIIAYIETNGVDEIVDFEAYPLGKEYRNLGSLVDSYINTYIVGSGFDDPETAESEAMIYFQYGGVGEKSILWVPLQGSDEEVHWIKIADGDAPMVDGSDTLPTASVAYRGKFYTVFGGEGVADVTYVCQKNTSDEYEWVAIN